MTGISVETEFVKNYVNNYIDECGDRIIHSVCEKTYPIEGSYGLIPGVKISRNSHSDDYVIKVIMEKMQSYSLSKISGDEYHFTINKKNPLRQNEFIIGFEGEHEESCSRINEFCVLDNIIRKGAIS